MKNSGINVKEKLIARYLEKDPPSTQSKSSNIDVLLNRIAVNKKNENRKKLYFSAASTSFGVSMLVCVSAKPLLFMGGLMH